RDRGQVARAVRQEDGLHPLRQGRGRRRSDHIPRVRALHLDARRDDGPRPRRARSAVNILRAPARIGPAEIPNRIVMPPMTTRGSDEEGNVTNQTIAYYMARVHAGPALITVEMGPPKKAARHRRRELGIYHDGFIPGLTRLVDEIH